MLPFFSALAMALSKDLFLILVMWCVFGTGFVSPCFAVASGLPRVAKSTLTPAAPPLSCCGIGVYCIWNWDQNEQACSLGYGSI